MDEQIFGEQRACIPGKTHGNIVIANPQKDYSEIRGTLMYADRQFHGCMKMRPDHFWYLTNCNFPQKHVKAYIAEAAIDAASLMLLHKYDGINAPAVYTSIGGAADAQPVQGSPYGR